MSHHLETVQWKVRLADQVDTPMLGPELAVDLRAFSIEEVSEVIKHLRKGKATGSHDILNTAENITRFGRAPSSLGHINSQQDALQACSSNFLPSSTDFSPYHTIA